MKSASETMLDFPIVIPSSPKSRPYHQWTFQSLSQVLKDKKLSCRVWKKCNDKQVLETACDHVNVSMEEFHAWLQSSADDHNILKCYGRSSHAAYIDYKYMKDVFGDCPEKLQEVQWGDFGLPGFDGHDSTIWIGSEGANTPGHQDSYGFNLVSQIAGRKLWILFPPSDTEYLYPTRIPYEESSVFTQVHLGFPDIERYPAVKMCHPFVVILHPGQTLYVPRHWWHYVESLDPSISINVWVPHKDDSKSHLTESLTRYLATSFLRDVKSSADDSLCSELLNPTESLCSQPENIHFLKCAIEKVLESDSSPSTNDVIQQVTDSKYVDVKDKVDSKGSHDRNHQDCDYLDDFAGWLKNLCSVSQASINPCLGFCSEHCTKDLDGRLNKTVVDGEIFYTENMTKSGAYNTRIGMEDNLSHREKGKEGVLTSCKRANEMEQCDFPSKRVKDNEGTCNDKHSLGGEDLSHDTSRFTCSSSESLTRLKEDDFSFHHVAYSLTKPFSFDRFSGLMGLKRSRDVKEKVKSSNLTFCKLQQSENMKCCAEHETRLTSFAKSDINYPECSGLHKQNVPISSPSTTTVHSSPFCSFHSSSLSPKHCTCFLDSHPDHSDTSIYEKSMEADSLNSFPERSVQNKEPSESIHEFDSDHNSNVDSVVSSDTNSNVENVNPSASSLSQADVQRFLFESVLHPSVVEQIASVFKSKCETLLNCSIKKGSKKNC